MCMVPRVPQHSHRISFGLIKLSVLRFHTMSSTPPLKFERSKRMRLASWQAFSHFAANRSDPNVRPAAVKLIQALCLQCGGSLSELVFTGFDTRFGIPGTYDVWRCSGCQLEQLFPVPSAQELKTLYETYYTLGAETGTRYTRLRERFFFFLSIPFMDPS